MGMTVDGTGGCLRHLEAAWRLLNAASFSPGLWLLLSRCCVVSPSFRCCSVSLLMCPQECSKP